MDLLAYIVGVVAVVVVAVVFTKVISSFGEEFQSTGSKSHTNH